MEKILLLGGSGLVGGAIADALQNHYQVIPTAGHHEVENGYCLSVDNPNRLLELLDQENPDIVISSLRGNFQAQMDFHSELAVCLAGKRKRLLYISTANVFDGNTSKPWTETDPPAPKSDYGVFKKDCESMLAQVLGPQLIIFRLSAVWNFDCPRLRQLDIHSRSGEPHQTHPGYMINITWAKQIGTYASFVLEHHLHGIFHVGTTDVIDYCEFEKKVCQALGFKQPEFTPELLEGQAFQAVIPGRKEIPNDLQMTVAQVLTLLGNK